MQRMKTSPSRLLMASLLFIVGIYFMLRPGAPSEPKGWKRVQAGPVSLALPPDFQPDRLHALAGEVGQWSSRRGIIGYSLAAAAPGQSPGRPDTREEVIGGHRVRIVTREEHGGLVEMEVLVPVTGAREMDLLLWGPEAGLEREFLSVVRSVRFEH